MASSIIIENIQLNAYCGVTETERSRPQPILVNLMVRCRNAPAFQSDQLHDTVDYGALVKCVRETGESQSFSLLEALTEVLCCTLFQVFPLTQLKIWVRKVHPPIEDFTGTVGIRLLRTRQDFLQQQCGEASPFLVAQLPRLPRGKALDVATGRGRHALFLAQQGFSVHGVDRNQEALEFLTHQAQERGGLPISTEMIDLEANDLYPPNLGTEIYDLILVFLYLYRPLFPRLITALKPGGVLLYETFLLENQVKRHHPRRKEFCLEPNELLTLLPGLGTLHYEEGDHRLSSESDLAFTARILARKP